MRKILVLLGILALLSGCGGGGEKGFTIKIPLVTWGGYAALFAANGGAKASTNSLFYKYGNFMVELIQEESVANQLQGFANGTYQIIWSTMDMIPLTYDSLAKDSRTIPQVIGLFDYSAGGDGIITRGKYASGKDFKGKKIVAAQYTPSHFYLLWYLNENGLSQNDIVFIPVADAALAKDTYVADKSIDVCVTWSPFIYDITDPKKESYIENSYLHATSAKGEPSYGTIADIYLARTDLVKEKPEAIAAFTKAMLEGYQIFLTNQEAIAEQIATFFGIKGGKDEVMAMFGDVTIAGPEENKQFFTESHKFSAHNIFKMSVELYKKAGSDLNADFNIDPKTVISGQFMLDSIK